MKVTVVKRLAHDVTQKLQGVIGWTELAEQDSAQAADCLKRARACAREGVAAMELLSRRCQLLELEKNDGTTIHTVRHTNRG